MSPVWTSGEAYSMRVRNAPGFPSDSSAPVGGTVGVDYQTPEGDILGVAVSAGNQTPEFSTGGSFNQVDEALSFYVANMAGPMWGNAVAAFDMFQDDIERPVPLGIFTKRLLLTAIPLN
ncbi:MAG: autotransporter domain-containing protein [Pirellulaceae bacterium]